MNIPAIRSLWPKIRSGRDDSMKRARAVARRCIVYSSAWINRRLLTETKVIGITGSAGKTTTKELCSAILSEFGAIHSSAGTVNEWFGLAETVRGIRREHRYAVLELSATRPGYMNFSLQLTRPHVGVVTLIARDHYSAFKSVDGIAREKAKVVSTLPPDGVAVLNIDDPLVKAIGESCNRRVVWIGENEGATLRLLGADSTWPEPLTVRIAYQGKLYEVRTQLNGPHLALPVLASLGVAIAMELPIERAIETVARVLPAEGRMQIVPGNDGVTFVRDDFKAPLWSLQAPFDYMKRAEASRKVIVIGTLSDYSLSATTLYPKVAKQALDIAELVVFVGPHAMRAMKAGERAGKVLKAFPSIRDAAAYLRTELGAGDLVLLKGSNKADHLSRLVVDRTAPVQCWDERCARFDFCGQCRFVHKPRSPAPTSPAAPGNNSPVTAPGAVCERGTSGVPVVVGLGNPGQRYSNTPHNIGYRALDLLCKSVGGTWEQQPEGLVSRITLGESPVILLKPGASMNRTGDPVRRFLNRVGSGLSQCIVIHDDVDLPFGDVRMKSSGGDAGHRGVRSVILAVGSGAFRRVRIGMRRSDDQRRAKELVLVDYSARDEEIVAPALEKTVSILKREVRKSVPLNIVEEEPAAGQGRGESVGRKDQELGPA